MAPMLALGFCAWVSAVAIEFSVVMTELIAELAVDSIDWPVVSAVLAAVTMPLS